MAEKASAAVLAELVHLARVGGEELDDAFQPLPDLRVDLVEPAADEAPRELAQQRLEAQAVLERPPEAVAVRGRPEEERHPGGAAVVVPARHDGHEQAVVVSGDAEAHVDDRLSRGQHLAAQGVERTGRRRQDLLQPPSEMVGERLPRDCGHRLVHAQAAEPAVELADGEGTHTPGRVRAAARLMGVVHAGRI